MVPPLRTLSEKWAILGILHMESYDNSPVHVRYISLWIFLLETSSCLHSPEVAPERTLTEHTRWEGL